MTKGQDKPGRQGTRLEILFFRGFCLRSSGLEKLANQSGFRVDSTNGFRTVISPEKTVNLIMAATVTRTRPRSVSEAPRYGARQEKRSPELQTDARLQASCIAIICVAVEMVSVRSASPVSRENTVQLRAEGKYV